MTTKFTDQQLKNFAAYVRVQESGRFNMFDPRARLLTGLGRDDYIFVMDNYTELQQQYEQQKASP